ncbi:MAG: deoxyribonuclease IV [Thaumarchaeota archaeon]|nr:deoxyribonuclease IV [Nitrososphaerota archaeon]
MREPLIGFHVSIAGSIDMAVDRALEADCTAFQLFTRNPRGWKFNPLRDEEIRAFNDKRSRAGFKRVVVHMPYLPNLASPIASVIKQSRASLTAEVGRCGALGVDYVVAHIGSHMGKGSLVGVRNVIDACNEALDSNPNSTSILIENTAGQKNSVGARFEELRMILDGVNQAGRIGVCLDTCHAFAAGFDISTPTGVDEMLALFESNVGLRRLKVVHLNDSKGVLGSNLDRHEHIGMGRIGEKGFRALLRHDRIAQLPLLMETPQDERRSDAEELVYVRALITG